MIKADAVLLDVDGTLWDSTALVAEAWMKALKEDGIDRKVTAEQLKKLFGKPMDVIADLLLPELDKETRYRALRHCMDREEKVLEENKKDISYPGVKETIRKLAGKVPVCIVSNCQSGYIELVCGKLGITDVIADKECYGDTGLYKADNIKKLVERNGYRAPVYVGDIAGDLEAAREAGVCLWEIGERIGLNDGNFSRKLRRELDDAETERVLTIIREISEGREKHE